MSTNATRYAIHFIELTTLTISNLQVHRHAHRGRVAHFVSIITPVLDGRLGSDNVIINSNLPIISLSTLYEEDRLRSFAIQSSLGHLQREHTAGIRHRYYYYY